ncbi:hypothetical protein D3C80_1976920 [compost metagenome]
MTLAPMHLTRVSCHKHSPQQIPLVLDHHQCWFQALPNNVVYLMQHAEKAVVYVYHHVENHLWQVLHPV